MASNSPSAGGAAASESARLSAEDQIALDLALRGVAIGAASSAATAVVSPTPTPPTAAPAKAETTAATGDKPAAAATTAATATAIHRREVAAAATAAARDAARAASASAKAADAELRAAQLQPKRHAIYFGAEVETARALERARVVRQRLVTPSAWYASAGAAVAGLLASVNIPARFGRTLRMRVLKAVPACGIGYDLWNNFVHQPNAAVDQAAVLHSALQRWRHAYPTADVLPHIYVPLPVHVRSLESVTAPVAVAAKQTDGKKQGNAQEPGVFARVTSWLQRAVGGTGLDADSNLHLPRAATRDVSSAAAEQRVRQFYADFATATADANAKGQAAAAEQQLLRRASERRGVHWDTFVSAHPQWVHPAQIAWVSAHPSRAVLNHIASRADAVGRAAFALSRVSAWFAAAPTAEDGLQPNFDFTPKLFGAETNSAADKMLSGSRAPASAAGSAAADPALTGSSYLAVILQRMPRRIVTPSYVRTPLPAAASADGGARAGAAQRIAPAASDVREVVFGTPRSLLRVIDTLNAAAVDEPLIAYLKADVH